MEKNKKQIENSNKKKLLENTCRNEMIAIEKSLLMEGVQDEKYLHVNDLFLDEKNYMHYAEISKVPRKENNHLVLVHGFGGNMFTYFRMIKYLKDFFYITLLDIPGQGFNYRDPQLININSTEKWIEYFVETLNKFMEKMNYKKFLLAGHSKGGYICAHYTKKYSNKVQMLYLISPAGFSRFQEGELEKFQNKFKSQSWIKRSIFGYVKDQIFEQKRSPFDFYVFPFRGFVLEKYLGNKRFDYSKEEKEKIKKLMHYFFTQPQYSERSLGYVLHYGIKSEMPIFEAIKDMKEKHIDIFIYYGVSDWMDDDKTQQVIRKNKVHIKVDHIDHSDHQIPVQNPEELSQKMINDYFKRQSNKIEENDDFFY